MPATAVAAPPLSNTLALVYVMAGIFASILLPVAVRALRDLMALANSGSMQMVGDPPPPTAAHVVLAAFRSYFGWGLLAAGYLAAAVLVAGVIVFMLGMTFSTARDALLAGFAWESLINKVYQ